MQDDLRNNTDSALGRAVGTSNPSGDHQLGIDLRAEEHIQTALHGKCAVYSSEENPVEQRMGGEECCVVCDPLDGSSIMGANLAVGTIFGVYPGKSLQGVRGEQQLAAGYALYGPRTDLVIATKQHGVLLQSHACCTGAVHLL